MSQTITYKRVLLKVSGEALMGGREYGLDTETIRRIAGDIGDEGFCQKAVEKTVKNAAEQHPQESIEKITTKQLERTFRTNIFSFFFMTKAALKQCAALAGQ